MKNEIQFSFKLFYLFPFQMLSCFPLWNPITSLLLLCLLGCYPTCHTLPSQHLPFLYPGSSRLHRTKGLPSHWCQIRHSLLHVQVEPRVLPVYTLVSGLIPESFWGMVGWYCCSSYGFANPLSSYSPTPNFSIGVPMLSPMFDCLYPQPYWSGSRRAVWGHLYQEPVSKCFLGSAIVPKVCVCRWDGSQCRAVSDWAFLHSVPHILSLHFLWQKEFWIDIFEVGEYPNSSTGVHAYLLDMVFECSIFPLLAISVNVLPVRYFS